MAISYDAKPGSGDANESEFNPFSGPAFAAAIPSTEAQREIWTATQITVDASLAFNESVSLRLRGNLQVDAIQSAIQALVTRHEALRSGFSADGMTMFVYEAPVVKLPVHDFSDLPEAEAGERFRAILAREVTESFDLTACSLVRFQLVTLAANDHVLVITAHHIVCDGWSFGIIVRDLAALYSAHLRGQEAKLPPADRFVDYVKSLDAEGSAELEQAERYWLGQFSGELPVLDLPSDRPRLPLKTYSSDREDWTIRADLIRRLKDAGSKKEASLFATLLSAFGVLLHRLSTQDNLVIGIPVAGQAATGHVNLVGHCVNMLPLRVILTPATRFTELLTQMRTTMLNAVEHQQMTLGSLLKRLPIPRDPSRLPLVSAILNVDRRLSPDSLKFDGLEAVVSGNPRQYETFDLFINAVEAEHGMVLECQYNTDLFDRATIKRWLASFERLLEELAKDANQQVDLIPMLSAADTETIAICNADTRLEPKGVTIHGLIAAQAAITPDAIAVECDGNRITYADLDARANQIGRHLSSLGVGRDVIVGLCMTRSIDMLAGLLGILKAGGGYLPLDPDYPTARLAFMAEDSAMRVILTEEKARAAVEGLNADRVVSIDQDARILDTYSAAPLPSPDGPEIGKSTAYVIYTSGSTGKPKGVVVPHQSVVNLLTSVSRRPGMSDRDVVLAITTLSFDIAVSELLLPLTVGARIVLATRDVATDGIRLARLIDDAGVNFIDATPATYRLLIASDWRGSPGLRLICTGEAMPHDLALALVDRAQEVWNAYGPTETTVWATMWRVAAPVEAILIGRPVANTIARVLDANLLEVPVGVRGELFIGGAAVATGYLNRPELTAERFVRDPFVVDANARMYRTGDVVRLLPDGNLECLGRTDHQVKIRGFRIELGEIESALLRQPGVAEAAVTVRDARTADARLVAYMVGAFGDEVTDENLRGALRQTLPDHMIPTAFVRLDRMPLTPSGKIDRKSLDALDLSPRSDTQFIEPRTGTERILAELWKEALGVGRVSVRDDFFALGGHSLLASQLLSRLRTEHGIEVSFRKIFETPTIERLAAFLDGSGATSSQALRASPIQHLEGATSAPLSVLQERLWLLQELDPPLALVQMHSGAWRFLGPLDEDLLERSLQEFARRHAMMRTSFRVAGGARIQTIEPEINLALSRLDLSALSEGERQAELMEFYRSQQATPFDLAVAPLFRATLIRCGTEDSILYTIRHGMIWDGWSFDIFVRELVAIYRAGATETSASLPDLPITYGDYARWQREWAAGPDAAAQSNWWNRHLDGELRALELPTDHSRSGQSMHAGGHVMLKFSASEVAALKNLARRHDTTLFMLALAAYNVLLHRYTGETDLLVGTPARGRTWSETENLVGPFVNTLVFRARLDPSMPFTDFLHQVRDLALESLSHQEMPFELLGKTPPVLRAFFSMQDARARPTSMGNIQIEQVHVPQTSASNDLMLWMMEGTDSLVAVLNYSRDLFEGATAMRMLAQLRTLLLSLPSESTRPIQNLNILPPDERAILLGADESAAERPQQTFYERFIAQVSVSPEAIALVADGESLTYRQLRDRAHQAAEYLRSLSLGDGVCLGVLLGPACVIPLLAALQRGASIMLIDGDDPAAYRDKLLENKVAAMITAERAAEQPSLPGIPIISPAASASGWQISAPIAEIPELVDAAEPFVMHHLPGPTGQPVLTVVSLSQQMRLLVDLCAEYRIEATDVMVATARTGVDVAFIELLLPLMCGAQVITAPKDVMSSGTRLSSFLAQVGATFMIAPLSIWRALADADWSGGGAFRAVVSGPPRTTSELSALSGRAGRVFTAYGFPEVGGWSAVHEVTPNDSGAIIGRAVGGARFYVLDDTLSPAPIGVVGQLYVASPALEMKDVAAAPPSPRLATAPVIRDRRLFRTGDRARRLADGTFSYHSSDAGRLRIDGPLVDLSAIETELRSHQSIADAVVAGIRDGVGVTRLVAYVVPQSDSVFTDTELRSRIRRKLPDFMTPQLFVEMESIPRNARGQVDRRRLPSPFVSEENDRSFVPPRTDSERLLAGAWQDALGLDRIDIRDNFFMLGGSSLVCFRLVEALQRQHGITLNPRALLLGSLEQAAAQMEQPSLRSQPTGPAPTTAPPSQGALKKLRELIEWKK